MNISEMVAELDAEINRLTEARDTLQALEGRTAGEPTFEMYHKGFRAPWRAIRGIRQDQL